MLVIPEIEWTKIEPTTQTPTQRWGHRLVSEGETVYVYGGYSPPDNSWSNDVWKFDMRSKKWEKLSTTGTKPDGIFGSETVFYNNNIYVFGGSSGFSYTNSISKLDLKTNRWERIKAKGKLPRARSHLCSTVYENKMIIFGGWDNWNNLRFNEVHSFDFKTLEWEVLEPKDKYSIPGLAGPTAHLFGSKLVVFGGNYLEKNTPKRTNDVFLFDLRKQVWEGPLNAQGTKPKPRASHSSILYKDRYLFIYGGWDGNEAFKDYCYFDLITKTWFPIHSKGSVPPGLIGHGSTYLPESNKMVLFAGDVGNRNAINDMFVLQFMRMQQTILDNFFNTRLFCDASVKCANFVEVPYHLCILQARCPNDLIFRSVAPSYKSSVVLSVLRFLYTDIIQVVPDDIEAVLQCAERLGLYSMIENMKENPNLENPNLLAQKKGQFNKVAEDLAQLYYAESGKDFTIEIGSTLLPIHKPILALRSGLFRDMFLSVVDTSNKAPDPSGRSEETLKVLIKFLYFNSIDPNVLNFDLAYELLDAVHYYQLQDDTLLQICVNYFKQNLNEKNFEFVLEKADTFDIVELIHFIEENFLK
ncbi:kelch domain-containing protein [Anaeramoeba ignava]|uniref:Kelch domain-containing protein n=1 Tax=Anaeramoeba ignava TaxID=1746090 RepID=A0A9Q0LP63_ANAIG|nr:kelch domain-containing protein [Anaeramoeba ignava]